MTQVGCAVTSTTRRDLLLLLLLHMHAMHRHTPLHLPLAYNVEIRIPAPHPHPRTKKVHHIWNDGSAESNKPKDTECPCACDGREILHDD